MTSGACAETERVLRSLAFEQMMSRLGFTAEDLARLGELGIEDVLFLDVLKECDLWPKNLGATDVDLSWLSDPQKCELLRLMRLAQELKDVDWLSDQEKDQLLLQGGLDLMPQGHGCSGSSCARCGHARRYQQKVEELMQHVATTANGWLNLHLPAARVRRLAESVRWVRVWA
jgi:hypothetical protein